jgi:hypothetical protein
MGEVRGYFKPESSFHTIGEWESIANEFLELQKQGFDTRGGTIDNNPKLIDLINKYFQYQLYIETEQFPDLTRRKVLDFIEDFVNHRVWSVKDEFKEYLVNIDNDRIAFFNSRGNIEPYVLLNEQFTKDLYGNDTTELVTFHWANKEGLINLIDGTKNGWKFEISTFTTQAKEFFRPESNILVKLKGTLVAAFKSDAKSFATDRGHKAANMYRLGYPEGESNLCRNLKDCAQNKTHLWNEIIIKPIEVMEYKEIKKY